MKTVLVPENIGDCVRLSLEDYRVKAEMTQHEMATRLGISQSAYSRWVSCSTDSALDAAKILGLGETGLQIMKDATERAKSHGML